MLHDLATRLQEGKRSRYKAKEMQARLETTRVLKELDRHDTSSKAQALRRLKRLGGARANFVAQALMDPLTKAELRRQEISVRKGRERRLRAKLRVMEVERRAFQAKMEKEVLNGTRVLHLQAARKQVEQQQSWITMLYVVKAAGFVNSFGARREEDAAHQLAALRISRTMQAHVHEKQKRRIEGAIKVIEGTLNPKIRQWRYDRAMKAVDMITQFLEDGEKSDVRPHIKKFMFNLSFMHVQLAKLQTWWRRRYPVLQAQRQLMLRQLEAVLKQKLEEEVERRWEGAGHGAHSAHPPGKAKQRGRLQHERELAHIRGQLEQDDKWHIPKEVAERLCTAYLQWSKVSYVREMQAFINYTQSILEKDKSFGKGASIMTMALVLQAGKGKSIDSLKKEEAPKQPKYSPIASPVQLEHLAACAKQYMEDLYKFWYNSGGKGFEHLATLESRAAALVDTDCDHTMTIKCRKLEHLKMLQARIAKAAGRPTIADNTKSAGGEEDGTDGTAERVAG
ncbi:unnamed protein product [Chrysoparadoxa australica]